MFLIKTLLNPEQTYRCTNGLQITLLIQLTILWSPRRTKGTGHEQLTVFVNLKSKESGIYNVILFQSNCGTKQQLNRFFGPLVNKVVELSVLKNSVQNLHLPFLAFQGCYQQLRLLIVRDLKRKNPLIIRRTRLVSFRHL